MFTLKTKKNAVNIQNKYLEQHFICNIWGFYGGDYDECRFLGWDAVWLSSVPPNCYQSLNNRLTLFFYFFYPEDGSDISSETSVYNKPTKRHILEDGILQNLVYVSFIFCVLILVLFWLCKGDTSEGSSGALEYLVSPFKIPHIEMGYCVPYGTMCVSSNLLKSRYGIK
jgi:hypothetical protein